MGPENVYVLFGSREQAEEASSVQFEISIGQYVTATRNWVEPVNIWKHIDDVAKVSQIPTRTSLLTNDSGFINETLLTRTLEDYITHSESQNIIDRIPTRTSQLENDEGFLSEVSWDIIANRPSIEGMASTEYVDNQVSSVQSSISEMVESKSPVIRRWTI